MLLQTLLEDWQCTTAAWHEAPAQNEAIATLERCFWKLLPLVRAQSVPPSTLASDRQHQEARAAAIQQYCQHVGVGGGNPCVVLGACEYMILPHDCSQQLYSRGVQMCT